MDDITIHWLRRSQNKFSSIISALKKAGLITVLRGTGGAELCADPSQITLYQIYTALELDGLSSLIGIHPCQRRPCPVARNIRQVFQTPRQKIEDSMKQAMEGIPLQSMMVTTTGIE